MASSSQSTTTTTTLNNTQNTYWGYLYNLFKLNNSLSEPDPIEETRKTLFLLTERYGSTHPSFRQGSYNEAVSFAKSKFKILLIYIHSSKHPNSQQFCKEILFTREFKEFIDSTYVIWACDISTSIGFKVFNAMRASTFPYLGMLCCNSISGLTQGTQTKIEDFSGVSLQLPRDQIMSNMTGIYEIYGPHLVVAKSEQDQREQDRFIRQEQDEAYLISLKQDQEKERLEKERLQREQEEREREEQEEQERLQKESEMLDRKESKKIRFEQEPTGPVSKVAIKLSDGTRIQRNFLKTDTIGDIMDYIDTKIQEPIDNYILMTSYPKKSLMNLDKTIFEEGLFPDALLFLSEK
ncbi:UAS domain-containing protein [Tieghemostelium lacteum]|uniref:UAS domain-containing protein n=1 Tax=Tieghemostelium lacteum TaxID=361077 RepID=A0A152AA02_TIELA|nr:UAS domain-containing protein [Tieghemostelium lacteum]|eukprot:KYR02965.1 UAS domain-containing protein [Tieghemostelium lacteum]